MRLQNSILLGTGGDNSDWDYGEFFEAAMTSGYPTDATENAVQADITAAGCANTPSIAGLLHAVGSDRCLDVNGGSTTRGVQLQIWDCKGGANQRWNINANGTITGVQSGICLGVAGAGATDGTKAQLWTCNGGTNQQWVLN